MNRKLIIVVAAFAFLCVVNAISISVKDRAVLQAVPNEEEVSGSDFGRSLLLLVNEKLRTKSPVSEISKLVDEIELRIKKEQQEDDAQDVRQTKYCTNTLTNKVLELQNKTSQIMEIKDDQAAANGTITALKAEVQTLLSDARLIAADLADKDAEIAKETTLNKNELDRLNQMITDHKNAVGVIEDVIIAVLQTTTPAANANTSAPPALSFIEVGTYSNEELARVLDNVVQVAQKAVSNGELRTVDDLVATLQKLQASIRASLGEFRRQHSASVSSWNKLKANLDYERNIQQTELDRVNDEISKKKTEVDSTYDRIAERGRQLQEISSLRREVEQDYKQETEICEKKKKLYNLHTLRRSDELRVIEQVRGLLRSQVARWSETLKQAINPLVRPNATANTASSTGAASTATGTAPAAVAVAF